MWLDFARTTPKEEVAQQMEEQIDDHDGPQIAIEICLIEAVLVQHILPCVEAGQVSAFTKAGCERKRKKRSNELARRRPGFPPSHTY